MIALVCVAELLNYIWTYWEKLRDADSWVETPTSNQQYSDLETSMWASFDMEKLFYRLPTCCNWPGYRTQ